MKRKKLIFKKLLFISNNCIKKLQTIYIKFYHDGLYLIKDTESQILILKTKFSNKNFYNLRTIVSFFSQVKTYVLNWETITLLTPRYDEDDTHKNKYYFTNMLSNMHAQYSTYPVINMKNTHLAK